MTWVIIIGFLVIVFLGLRGTKKAQGIEKAFINDLRGIGIDYSQKIDVGSYVGGHPDIDDVIHMVFCFKRDDKLTFYAKRYKKTSSIGSVYYDHIGDVPIGKIKDIIIEDASTIERKVTLGRAMLVGVFALAWKKRKKNDETYLNIEWNDGKFNHETLFHFENNGAFNNANKARNALIKLIR